MARTFAQITALELQILQDTGAAIYDSTETEYWNEEGLKEFAVYDPHIVDVIFKIESRTGTATSTSSGKLVDATKDQFVDADDDDEKVIHNTTDNTWSVVETYTDAENLVLTTNIMASGEGYAIYNKQCRNDKQIYIGDMPYYLWIDSVEYPIGEKRNWKVYGRVLEIDVDSVEDSDLTATTLPDIDVLIRFAMPHRLCQLTDFAGLVNTAGSQGDKTLAADGFSPATGKLQVGDEFYLADHRTLYTITFPKTLEGGAALSPGAGLLAFYPGLEAPADANSALTFVSSTLKPQHEELFCHLVAARAVLSDNITKIDAINKGGTDVWQRYQVWGERKLGEVIGKMERLSPPRTKRRYSTA